MAHIRPFWTIFEPLLNHSWTIFGPFWTISELFLEPFWTIFRPFMDHISDILGHFWTTLDNFWTIVEPFSDHFWTIWTISEPFWEPFYVSPLLSYLGSLPAMEEVETVKILSWSDKFRSGTIKWLFYENYRAFALLGQNVPELMGSGIAVELQLHPQLLSFVDESYLLMEFFYWWKLCIDESCLLMKVVY